jgi:predicted nucleic acid-binding protein
VRKSSARTATGESFLSLMPIEIYPSRLLAAAAVQIACETDLTVYDSLYIAPLKDWLIWVGDFPP